MIKHSTKNPFLLHILGNDSLKNTWKNRIIALCSDRVQNGQSFKIGFIKTANYYYWMNFPNTRDFE